MAKKRKKPFGTTGPKEGKKKSFGHGMGGLFGVGPKKTEPDSKPPKRSQVRAARIARLSNRKI